MIGALGKYLDREIIVGDGTALAGIGTLSSALVMIWFDDASDDKAAHKMIDEIIARAPLGIAVAGANSDRKFDYLLEKLSVYASPHHIMTKVIREHNFIDAIGELFVGFLPDEDVFDSWNQFIILKTNSIGSLDLQNIVALLDA